MQLSNSLLSQDTCNADNSVLQETHFNAADRNGILKSPGSNPSYFRTLGNLYNLFLNLDLKFISKNGVFSR